MLLKLIDLADKRGGVPVFSLPNLKPAERRDAERPTEGASLILPAGKDFNPVVPF